MICFEKGSFALDLGTPIEFPEPILAQNISENTGDAQLVLTEKHVFLKSSPDSEFSSIYEYGDKEFALLIGDKVDVYAVFAFSSIPGKGGEITIKSVSDNKAKINFSIKGYPLISPDGTYLVALNRYSGDLFFHDMATGNVIQEINIKDSDNISFEFSSDGKYFALNVPGQETHDGNLLIFNNLGEITAKIKNNQRIAEISISPNSQFIALCAEDKLSVFGMDQKPLYDVDLKPGGNNCLINDTGQALVSRREDNSLTFLDMNGNILWKTNIEGLKGFNSIFTSLIMNKNKIYVSVEESWKKDNSKCYLLCLDYSGHILSKIEIPSASVKLESTSQKCYIIADNLLYLIK